MKRNLKITLIVVVCLILGLVLTHLMINNIIPYIQDMHSGMY